MTWEEFTAEIRALAAKVDGQPDIIIGIARGGVVPAVLLSRALGVKDLFTLKVRKEGAGRVVVADGFTSASGRNVLLVEDMLETGQSMEVAKEFLEKEGAVVKTACLYIMPITKTNPDYLLREVQSVQRFPWEV